MNILFLEFSEILLFFFVVLDSFKIKKKGKNPSLD